MTMTKICTRDPLSFGDAVRLGSEVEEPVAQARLAANQVLTDGRGEAGVWECTPGRFQRQVMQAEYSYIISGEGSFTAQGGQTVDFAAGDVLYFSANTHGTWDIRSTVRKTYIILA
ncbi:cupin domain-containing protein [Pseudomonas sp. NPDC090592]|uniref:cupin domain-containing protein n=1 Tax=Pseudomonas sp. NPDC090592 TaxID=3364480 RepID=UPI003839E697